MKRLLLSLLATALAAPALAQHHGHHMPGHTMPAAKAKPQPAAKKPAAQRRAVPAAAKAKPRPAAKSAAKAPAKRTAAKPASKAAAKRPAGADNPHAGHRMPAEQTAGPAADPHAGHQMQPDPHARHAVPQGADPHAGHQMQADPHAGHTMPQGADPHAGHQMTAAEAPPVTAPPPGAFSGPAHAADAVFGAQQMAAVREEMYREHGDMITYKVLVDQIEARIRDGHDGYQWDAQAWVGGDINKAWFKTEGEGEFGGRIESAEVQALWSRAIDPWFDLQAGIRHDFRPEPQRTHFVLGLQGLAPYWFEVDAAAFLSTKGDVTARVEAEYDQRITQKLILQPRAEFDLAAQDIAELGIGSGLSTAEAGVRLRYEIVPQFAPYVGVEYERAFGGTADFRRAAGEKAGGWNLLLGLRTWF